MKTLIQRDTGDNIAAQAVVDELCITELVCTERGKTFLYSEGFDTLNYEIQLPYRQAVNCGEIVEIMDVSLGQQFFARVSGWSLNIDANNSMSQTITRFNSILV